MENTRCMRQVFKVGGVDDKRSKSSVGYYKVLFVDSSFLSRAI
jgi:hypothetical protein